MAFSNFSTSHHRRPTVVGSDYSPFSKSPGNLHDVTMDQSFSVSSYQSPVMIGSPIQGRTMKDYEEQLSSLRKENFNLKLNVYFLEERLYESNTNTSQDNILKRNIELKIKLEKLQRDLNEKQDLLCDAARALELMENSAARKESELLTQISSMEDEIHALRKSHYNIKDDRISNCELDTSNITVGVDDSVALYAAAFNLNPTPDEVKSLLKKSSKNEPCECHQLRALLTVEKENVVTLKDNMAARDLQISELKQQIQEAEEKLKLPLIKSESDNSCDKIKEEAPIKDEDGQQLEKLQQENLNACQMIQGCLVRIKQMDRENKKIKNMLKHKEDLISKLQMEEASSEKSVEDRYREIVKLRDCRISELENELKTYKNAFKEGNDTKNSSHCDDKEWNWMNSHLEQKINMLRESMKPESNVHTDSEDKTEEKKSDKSNNMLELLVKRLQEMAYVFDSLLSNRCIIGEDKRRKVENLLEQTVDLPVGLKLDPNTSHILEETFMDSSFTKPQMKLDDLTMMFGHHLCVNDSSQVINYKHLDESLKQCSDSNVEYVLECQRNEIDKLKNQIKAIKSKCICESAFEDDSGDKPNSYSKSSCCEHNKLISRKSKSKMAKCLNSTWHGFEGLQVDNSESECWSEPDRSVSMARMGVRLRNMTKELNSSDEEMCNYCRKHKYGISTESRELESVKYQMKNLTQIKTNLENLLNNANTKIGDLEFQLSTNKEKFIIDIKYKEEELEKLNDKLQQAENGLNQYISKYQHLEKELNIEIDKLKIELDKAQTHACDVEKLLIDEKEKCENQAKLHKDELKNVIESSKMELKEFQNKVEKDWISRIRYEALRKELDNGALQASQATLDKALATEQKIRSDAEADRLKNKLGEAQMKINKLETVNSDLQNRLMHFETSERVLVDSRWMNRLNVNSRLSSGHSSPQASSSDHSLENERLPIMNVIDTTIDKYNQNDLAAENTALRERLARMQKIIIQLKESQQPQKMQRSMCNEIHKTYSLLRQVRDNLNQN